MLIDIVGNRQVTNISENVVREHLRQQQPAQQCIAG